jgi:hypothetical protein
LTAAVINKTNGVFTGKAPNQGAVVAEGCRVTNVFHLAIITISETRSVSPDLFFDFPDRKTPSRPVTSRKRHNQNSFTYSATFLWERPCQARQCGLNSPKIIGLLDDNNFFAPCNTNKSYRSTSILTNEQLS